MIDPARVEITVGSKQADMDFIIDLGKRTVETSISTARPAALHEAQTAYLRMLDFAFSKVPVLFIATYEGRSLGFVLYVDFLPDDVTGADQAFVAYMAVEEDARGLGIGRRLLAAVEERARAQGLANVALMVTEDNVAARAVYEQAGYATERRLLCKRL